MLGGFNVSILGIYPMLDFQLFIVPSIVALKRDPRQFLKQENWKSTELKWLIQVAEVVSCQPGTRYRVPRWS